MELKIEGRKERKKRKKNNSILKIEEERKQIRERENRSEATK